MQNYIIADEKAPLSFFKKNGYYIVGNKIFNFKINALEEATRTSLPITWEFNTEEFKSVNWRNDSLISIEQVYRMRAQQLRDQYDYLVLAYSGGADSDTVLKSFINNNIHLDEIICDWSLSQTNNSNYKVSMDTAPENYTSEWELAIKPTLEYITKNFPKIKITLVDSTETLTIEDFEDTCTVTHNCGYVSVKRYRKISQRIRDLADQHNQVGLIIGLEKPRLSVERGILCASFFDSSCWIKSSYNDGYKKNIEYFYWAQDLPEIVAAQSRLIYQAIKHNTNVHSIFKFTESDTPEESYKKTQLQREFIKHAIYPNWDNRFQAQKGSSPIYSEQYEWLWSKNKTIELESWESSMNARLALVDKNHLILSNTGKFLGYRTNFVSRSYPVGKI